jgi:two-component system NtrC family sensor kinase
MKLAALAAVGVVAMHAVHLTLGNRIAARALAKQQEALGRGIARLVAEHATDPILVADVVTLDELVRRTAAGAANGVVYCFVVRGGRVLATSFAGATPTALLALRPPGDRAPVVVRDDGRQLLDLAEPILGGELGEVRLGLDMGILRATRHDLAVQLGLLAVAVILAGLAAAFVFGRGIARPMGRLLDAADRFDPARQGSVSAVPPRGSDEVAVLTDRFNRMMERLEAAHAEQQLARQRGVETARMVALGSLVAGVAHEVNNPLAGLKNCIRRLERDDLLEAKRREYLALMEDGLGRIEELVRRLLDFGRPHPTVLEPVPAAELAREARRLMLATLERRRISCAVRADGASAMVLADRRKVGQALVNLLLNAAYVTAEGGEVGIGVRRRPGLVGLAVEDRGPGIPSEIRDRILDPFFSTKPEGEGTGLGLSVTRTIVDAHGGDLTFDFPAGGGTIATVWLREAAVEPRAAVEERSRLAGERTIG